MCNMPCFAPWGVCVQRVEEIYLCFAKRDIAISYPLGIFLFVFRNRAYFETCVSHLVMVIRVPYNRA